MKSKVITLKYSDEANDCFHYRVETWKGKKVLLGWLGTDSEDDCKYDITDWSDLSLYQFDRLYMRLAVYGHLLDLERTVQEQQPIFADNSWKIAKAIGKTYNKNCISKEEG
tara:strand:- start:552 stop:884 length:333 start_codon:yes stop_codon:yes gene_type:complete